MSGTVEEYAEALRHALNGIDESDMSAFSMSIVIDENSGDVGSVFRMKCSKTLAAIVLGKVLAEHKESVEDLFDVVSAAKKIAELQNNGDEKPIILN
jgi:hypothetical protein